MRLGSSFRDPSGFVFEKEGELLRQVNKPYEEDFLLLESSGLLDELVRECLVVPTEQVGLDQAITGDAVAVLRPERIPFISYPYEWCFSQFKDAALLTLDITERALGKGMVLKDASAYNVQFVGAKPYLIDTLSFERYVEGEPWVAYRQFCQHFLAPLALMAHVDPRLNALAKVYIDGVPLDLAASMLPKSTKWKPALLTHIHMHSRVGRGEGDGAKAKAAKVSKIALMALLANLKSTVNGLDWKPEGTVWGDYYQNTNYADHSMNHKRELVAEFAEPVVGGAKTCWDLGANTGEFSRIAAEKGYYTVAWDVDPAAVEKGYRALKQAGIKNALPLIQDLTNPSPSIGWNNEERDSFQKRGPADLVLALALIHHLAIGNNVPLPSVAKFFAGVCSRLVIEFVPKEDSQVERMLSGRKDVFDRYNLPDFEAAFSEHFEVLRKESIRDTHRTLFLMRAIQ